MRKSQVNPLLPTLSSIKTAIVYDRVNTAYGGAEQVVLALHKLFPQATLFTSVFYQKKAPWAQSFNKVIPSFLNKLPFFQDKHQWLLPFMPLAFESLDLSEYQLVISVTSAEAKGVITRPDQFHLCYLLTPPRYLYQLREEYLKMNATINIPVIKQLTKLFLRYLHWWDQVAIYRPDIIVPLSKSVATRINTTYGITVDKPIYPPIDLIDQHKNPEALLAFNLPEEFNLVVSRLVFYKRIDLAIRACAVLNQNLVIVGEGKEKKHLQSLIKKLTNHTSSKIFLLPSLDQQATNSLMEKAKLFLAPGIDDFGIAPLQANLFGTPSIINSSSGVAEVFDQYGFGSMIFSEDADELATKIKNISSVKKKSDNIEHIRTQFGTKKFINQITQVITQHIGITFSLQ